MVGVYPGVSRDIKVGVYPGVSRDIKVGVIQVYPGISGLVFIQGYQGWCLSTIGVCPGVYQGSHCLDLTLTSSLKHMLFCEIYENTGKSDV